MDNWVNGGHGKKLVEQGREKRLSACLGSGKHNRNLGSNLTWPEQLRDRYRTYQPEVSLELNRASVSNLCQSIR